MLHDIRLLLLRVVRDDNDIDDIHRDDSKMSFVDYLKSPNGPIDCAVTIPIYTLLDFNHGGNDLEWTRKRLNGTIIPTNDIYENVNICNNYIIYVARENPKIAAFMDHVDTIT